MVVQTCSLSYTVLLADQEAKAMGLKNQSLPKATKVVQNQPRQLSESLFQNKNKKDWECSLVLEHLPRVNPWYLPPPQGKRKPAHFWG